MISVLQKELLNVAKVVGCTHGEIALIRFNGQPTTRFLTVARLSYMKIGQP